MKLNRKECAMKTHLLRVRTGTYACLILLSPGFGNVLRAQGAPQKPASTAEMSPPRYDLEVVDGNLFRDGKVLEATLGNVVDVLRERYPDANIVLSPGLAKLKVSDLKLRAGRLEDELEALRIASGEKFGVQAHAGPNGPMDPATGLPMHGNKAGSDLFILRGEVSPTRTIEAFNIDPYLQWVSKRQEDLPKSLEELKSMIRDAISQLNPNEPEFPSFS